ncbi:MAG: response regulator [Defluviitaleaceae bacterium]|nr:response regulator [Defluviitaleaceae bacterium]
MELFDGSKYYHKIPGLWVPKTSSYNQIHTGINLFIDTIPNLTQTIEDNFVNFNKHHDQQAKFVRNMEMMRVLLKDVHARGLESEAGRILLFANQNHKIDLLQKMMKPFITDVLSLSVAMQKAQNSEKGEKEEALGEIEINANMLKNISAISNLFEDTEYGKAQTMIIDLVEYDPAETAFASLLGLTVAKKYVEAKVALATLKEKYNEAVIQLAGVDLSKKILAVDDMPEILSFVNNALRNNYKVIAVPSGKAALKVLESQKPDLFILDIDMPEMNGYELAERIRNMSDYAKTPLVFLTGNSTREHITKAMQVGCDDFIVKPASHEYLLTKVGKFLNK